MNGTTTQTGTGRRTEAAELLGAGAVLPPGTGGAGERAVPLTARGYRHPALEGRTVVRLVAQELGAAEDLAAGFLGLEPAGEPAVVGLGLRQALGFPEWVLAHHPEDGAQALALVPGMERAARQARSAPKAAMEAYRGLGARLAASLPHFLPTFLEQAARAFLAVENTAYAAQLFGAARRAEAEHGLAVDEDRLEDVLLEFALAGALPVRVLSGYAKGLSGRLPAGEALRRFRALCVRRCAGGMPPSVQMATDLRRLARAAGEDAEAAEQEYLAELLELPAVLRAPVGWWRAHRAALAAAGRRDPAVRRTLLEVLPRDGDPELLLTWLEVLEESGAAAGLTGEDPDGPSPADGAAGWLQRFLDVRGPRWGSPRRLPPLYGLVERAAPRLREETATGGGALRPGADLDLLDLLLSLDVPVADPADNALLHLERWAGHDGRRDLAAVAADKRFHDAFRRGADRLSGDTSGVRTVRALAAAAGGRPLLAAWVADAARRARTAGLPDLPGALARLAWMPREALLLAAEEVAEAARGDLAGGLARTLRGGLFDELGWSAWEEALAELVRPGHRGGPTVADAWPQLVVAGPAQVRVIDAGGTVLTHDLRIPAGEAWNEPGFHWVDGDLLVFWSSRRHGGRTRGYWHRSADRVLDLEAAGGFWGVRDGGFTLPLPGGGRTTGAGVLHAGDTAVPGRRRVVTDGTSHWVWDQDLDTPGWRAYDPASGRLGQPGLPGFLADALRSAPEGSRAQPGCGWLRPAPADGAAGPAGVPVGGLLGWRTVRLPDGRHRGEDLAGRTVTTAPGQGGCPDLALTLPGDDRPRAVVAQGHGVVLVDPDGSVTASAGTHRSPGPFAAGTAQLPPLSSWHCLRVRDPEGSAALRRVGRDTAVALLEAVAASGAAGAVGEEERRRAAAEVLERVRVLLPGVTHEALLAGVVGVARHAAEQQAALERIAARLAGAPGSPADDDGLPPGPEDDLVRQAAAGLVPGLRSGWWATEKDSAFRQMRRIGRALREGGEAAPGASHLAEGAELPVAGAAWWLLPEAAPALAYRYAAPHTPPEQRAVLGELLAELARLGLLSADGAASWRGVAMTMDEAAWTAAGGRHGHGKQPGLLPLGGGALLAVVDDAPHGQAGRRLTALLHDPAGRFALPHPYTGAAVEPAADAAGAARTAAAAEAAAVRGPAPWRPEAAEEFARLTGVTRTTACLVLAGMPGMEGPERGFLPAEALAGLGVRASDAAVARDGLRRLSPSVRRELLAALLPADPERLWSDGPDTAAAAAVWAERVGRRAAVPEWLVGEAVRSLRPFRDAGVVLPALLDPSADPGLTRDLRWEVRGDRAVPAGDGSGFTAHVLADTVAAAAWLAHRLPVGDPARAALPAVGRLLRERLAHPGLLLDLGRYVSLPAFRRAAGAPSETGPGFERWGAVVLATRDDRPAPAVRPDLLDAVGGDPYLAALRGTEQEPFPVEAALRTALSDGFAALLADPGDPAAGERDADGTWWPQDPTRSVPDLVAEAAAAHGLGADAAALYLVLLAMPDPTDRSTARWTGWKPRRLKAARAELAASGLVVEADRSRAGRSLFLPGGWAVLRTPQLPVEQWKLTMFGLAEGQGRPPGAVTPLEPAAALYRRAWQRVLDGDGPRFEELRTARGRRR
ncbi:DNA-binding protein [Streptomyces sp. NPDC001380]|uniref:DNA-binding protein n=1 Tax=Streptomyces sp. NPDC001380 TaxID=3364566 RepID=UPI0036ACB670